MERNFEQEIGMSRRTFLTGAAVSVLGTSAAAMLAGCSSPDGGTVEASATAGTVDKAKSPWGDYFPWSEEAPEIADTDVEEELDCDVAVIGLGVSGVAAFRAAAEAGASVIGIEKASEPQCRSSQYAYLNGGRVTNFGLETFDLDELAEEEFTDCTSMTNYKTVRRFFYESAEALDWWIDGVSDIHVQEPGEMLNAFMPSDQYPCFVAGMGTATPGWQEENQAQYPLTIAFSDHPHVLDANFQDGVAKGGQGLFGHFAEKLIVDEDGAVKGVYARDAGTGKYKKINTGNGVVMASGCCRSNEDMVRYFCPSIILNGNGNPWPNIDVEGGKTNTGDGYKMGWWAGAALTQYQSPMMHIMGGPGDNDSQDDSTGVTAPFLRINYDGERFMNEDTQASDAEYAFERQPKHKGFCIVDSHMDEQLTRCVSGFGSSLAEWDERVGDGTIFKGDTLEELFSSIEGMDAEAALATVAHYNELCAAGKDTDFTKKAKYLFPIQDGPFYAQRMGVGLVLTMTGGLDTDHEAHVLNWDRHIVKGLYASGNVQGGRFAVKYPQGRRGQPLHGHVLREGSRRERRRGEISTAICFTTAPSMPEPKIDRYLRVVLHQRKESYILAAYHIPI